jgi:hypothetical protein
MYYIFMCVCVCVCVCVARARERARVYVRVPGNLGVCMRVRACSLAYPAYNSHAP